MALIMTRWGQSTEGKAQWRIGTEDGGDVRFPSDVHLQALLKKHSSANGDLVVLKRESNSILVEAPADLKIDEQRAFLAALWMKTVFK
jgi:hypothetical protein